MIYISTNKDLYETIRSVIPYAVYLRRPHRLLIFWNIAVSLSPAFIGYITAKHKIYIAKTPRNSNYRTLITAFLLAIACIYILGALTWAYSAPFSVLANYEPVYSSYTKSWRQDVIKHIWDRLNMSNSLHRDLTVTYVDGIHAFSYNYPGFTDSQDTFMWTKHYRYSPSYKDILSLYGIKYVITEEELGKSLLLPLYYEYDGIEIKQVPHGVERIYVGYPLLVIGGSNTLSVTPILMRDLVQEVLHLLTNDTPTLVPIFANSLSLEQFNFSTSRIDTIVLHNSGLLDLIALQGMYHHWSIPIVDIREPQKVKKVIDAGWKFFEPKYYGYITPSGMHDSVYGQVTYGDYALYAIGTSNSLKRNFAIKFDGTYTLMLRLGRFSVSRIPELNIVIKQNNEMIRNSTIKILWLGFRWVTIDLGNISRGNYIIVLTPHSKLYIDNVIIVLPKTCFNEYHEWASRLIRSKHIIYIYEPSSYTENLTGYASLLPVKYSASDPSLGALLLHNTSEIKMKSYIAKGNYLLFIRYKSMNPQAINITATVSNKEMPLIKIARSIDGFDWFYTLYFLRVNSMDSNNILTLKIRSICDSVYVDFLSLISTDALRNIYSIPQYLQISSNIKTKIGKFLVIFQGVKWGQNGFYFDGVDDCIKIRSLATSITFSKFTILVLLKAEGKPLQVFVAKDVPPDGRERILWWAGVDNHIKGLVKLREQFVISDSGISPIIDKYALHGLIYNGSHLVIVANDKSQGLVSIRGTIPNTNAPIIVGCRGDRKVFFKGYILSILIYNRALNLQALQQISKDPLNPPRDGLVLYLNPHSVKAAFNCTNLIASYPGKIEWSYDLKYNKIISGKITCFKSLCVVVFSWPMRLPNEWIMRIKEKTILPVKALYMLHGYIIKYRGIQYFELRYNPSTLTLLAKIISLSSWLIVSIYLILSTFVARAWLR